MKLITEMQLLFKIKGKLSKSRISLTFSQATSTFKLNFSHDVGFLNSVAFCEVKACPDKHSFIKKLFR